MALQEFKIDKAKATLEDWKPAKNDKGGNVYVLHLVADVTDDRFLDDLVDRWPEVEMLKALGDAPAREWKQKRRLGDVNLKVLDPAGVAVVVDIIGGKGWAPMLRVSQKAEKVFLDFKVTAAVPKTILKDLNDYYKAEVLVTLVSTNVDLEDEAKKKTTPKKKVAQQPLRLAPVDPDVKEAVGKPQKKAARRPPSPKKGGRK